MKAQFFALFDVLLVQSASAQTPTPTPPTLAGNMDSIYAIVKTITTNANDASKNVASAAAAGQLVTLFTTTLAQAPAMVSTLPATQQAAALSGYQGLIQKEIDDAKALQAAFKTNNNAGAATILQDMNTIKSQGHSAYAN